MEIIFLENFNLKKNQKKMVEKKAGKIIIMKLHIIINLKWHLAIRNVTDRPQSL